MKILIESETIKSKNAWLDKMALSDAEWVELLEAGVIVPQSPSGFVIDFVGLIATQKQVFIAFPKFFANSRHSAALNDAWLIARVLKAYWSDKKKTAVSEQEQRELTYKSEEVFREYEVFLSLLAWYRSHGPYRVTQHAEIVSSSKQIHWPKTLARTLPIHNGPTTFYPEPVIISSKDEQNYVTTIQLSVLRYLSHKYQVASQTQPFMYELVELGTIPDEILINDTAAMALRVQQEQSQVFRTDTITMLQNLKAFFDLNQTFSGPEKVQLFGTTAFYAVWEHACAVVLASESELLSEKLSQPVWHFEYPINISFKGGRQRPDILKEPDANTLAVFDAKYYYPLPTSICGWGDLVKQYFYEKSYHRHEDMKAYNCLLFPGVEEQNVRFCAKVLMEYGRASDEMFPAILVFSLNAMSLLKAYLNPLGDSDWLSAIVHQSASRVTIRKR